MRFSRLALALVTCTSALLFALPHPAKAQDVIVLPHNADNSEKQGANENDGGKDPDLLNYYVNKNPAPKTPQASVNAKKAQADTPPAPRNGGKKRKPPVQQETPPEVADIVTKQKERMSGMMDALRNPPTLVLQSPEFKMPTTGADAPTYEHDFAVSVDALNFTEGDLTKIAAGTEIKPENILKECEPRITGSVINKEGGAELIDWRASGTARSGYKGSINSINLVLALACKFDKVPTNKGAVARIGEYYVLGVAQGTCPPPPNGGGASGVALSYAGDGRSLTCIYK